eukprot:TRINITY_DN67166_c0_g1_i1.p1 TRINITY_DN67166_c0_g1~~TRINITY_DN67166_c0_g1_i1.p1  ORF type:complete len:219 (+),score=43.52 TRINITY_DN67166_c0_g1_i1:54-710(+)
MAAAFGGAFNDIHLVGEPNWDSVLVQAGEHVPDDGYPVVLHAYDLSNGLAKALSHQFLGKHIPAIWHTAVVVYGREWFFGGGICHAPPGRTQYGTPIERVTLGTTHVPPSVFREFLSDASPRFTAMTYNLMTHNCNNFSDEVCEFLVGEHIPAHITGLPAEIMNTPLGQSLGPLMAHLGMPMGVNPATTAAATAAGMPMMDEEERQLQEALRLSLLQQ